MPILINGESLSDASVEEQYTFLLARIAPGGADVDERLTFSLRQTAVDNAILQVILRQHAARARINVTAADIAAELAHRRGTAQSVICGVEERIRIERDIRCERFIDQVARGTPRPGKRDLEAVYTADLSRFREPERVRLRHIVSEISPLKTEAQAAENIERARHALELGVPFRAVAEEFSDCLDGGGDLGWISRGEMVAPFEEVAFSLSPGEVSHVFRTVFGFHIAMVLERVPARALTFDEVRSSLAAEVYEERRQARLTEYLTKAAQAADIRSS